MSEMFCFQCEQTANGSGCTGPRGICTKEPEVAALQDHLMHGVQSLALFIDAVSDLPSLDVSKTMAEAIFSTRLPISLPF